MTTPSARQAIETARAALFTFLAGTLREAHLAVDGIELFIARDGAGPNPMRDVPEIAAGEESTMVTAPHIATLVSISAAGTKVTAGVPIAVLRVLDEELPLFAPMAGIVGDAVVQPGDLLDYGAVIVSLRLAAE